jgi:hypothetical protein
MEHDYDRILCTLAQAQKHYRGYVRGVLSDYARARATERMRWWIGDDDKPRVALGHNDQIILRFEHRVMPNHSSHIYSVWETRTLVYGGAF